jgi:hypothetical protein
LDQIVEQSEVCRLVAKAGVERPVRTVFSALDRFAGLTAGDCRQANKHCPKRKSPHRSLLLVADPKHQAEKWELVSQKTDNAQARQPQRTLRGRPLPACDAL